MAEVNTGFDNFHPMVAKKQELGEVSSNTEVRVRGLVNVVELKPTDDIEFDVQQVGDAGQMVYLMVEGGEEKTLTMGDKFIATGTLDTGSTDDRMFVIKFVSDGELLYEVSRTTAMDIS